jgi:hypothetical protein
LVSAVDGVEGFGAGGVLTLDTVSDTDEAELPKPAPCNSRVMAAAASVSVFSRSGSVSGAWSAAVLPGVAIGSDADAPSGLAGVPGRGRALLDGRESLGVTTAFGTVTSERLPCASASDGASGTTDREDEPSAEDEPDENESDARPLVVLAWTVVSADSGARAAPTAKSPPPAALAADVPAGTDRVLRTVPSASAPGLESAAILASVVTLESSLPPLLELVSDSLSAAFDFRAVLSS